MTDETRRPVTDPPSRAVGYAAPPASGWIGQDLFDLRRLWAIFLRRSILFFPVALVVFAFVVMFAMQATPVYRSTAGVLIESLQRGSLDQTGASVGGMPNDNNAIDTQVQLVTSQAVTARVIKQLNLAVDPEFAPGPARKRRPSRLKRFFADPLSVLGGGRAQPASSDVASMLPNSDGVSQQLINNVSSRILARRNGLTYVVNIVALSYDPEKAAQLANAYAAAFIQAGLDAKLTNSRNASGALGEQLFNLQRQMVVDDAAVQNYKINNNLMSASGGTIAEQEVSALNTQIAAAEAEAAAKETRLSSARAQIARGGGGQDVGATLSSDTIARLRAQESESTRELAELNTRYGERYPAVLKAKSQLEDVREQIKIEIKRIMSSLEAEAEAARQRVASLRASQAGARGALVSNSAAQTGLLELQRKADASRQIYEAFLNRAKETSAQATVQQPDARIVTVAEPSSWPSSPNLKLAATFGAALALGAGLMIVILAELLDSGLQTGTDVERRFGIPYAGSIPTLRTTWRKRKGRGSPADYLIDNPFSTFAETLRSLRAFLMLQGGADERPRVIALTSALPGEGKSLTSYCFARTLAAAGSTVVLVDCDLRRRGASSNVRPNKGGLQEVLTGQVTLDEALVKDERTNACILPALEPPASGLDPFATPAMTQLLETLKQRFEYVLLDTAPVLAVSDTRLLAAKADAVLMLVQWRRTPFRAADTAIDLLLESGSNIAGIALSRVDLRQQSRYGYGDRNYYYKALKSYYTD